MDTIKVIKVERLASIFLETEKELDDLVIQSGWNQTAQDWSIFLRLGTICIVRSPLGRIIASGAVLPMGSNVAWISMILVSPDFRSKGLGKAVLRYCIEHVHSIRHVAYLDATPAGEGLYLQHGFKKLAQLTRWRRVNKLIQTNIDYLLHQPDIDALSKLDANAFGADRAEVLKNFLSRKETLYRQNPRGFVILRQGRTAHQIGPLVASDELNASRLFEWADHYLADQVYIDVVDQRKAFTEKLKAHGYVQQRSFTRMMNGLHGNLDSNNLTYAIAGPEFG